MRSAVEEEENDQVSNHVMTRSAYNQKKFMDYYANRRITRSLFKQQQEQKGDEKPQQQQQKKRKRKNKKKKKPVVDDTPKISWGSRYMRYFTLEEREAYQKKLKESEGFDVGKYTSEVALSNLYQKSPWKNLPSVEIFPLKQQRWLLELTTGKSAPNTSLSSSSGCVTVFARVGCITLPFRPSRMGWLLLLPVTSKLAFIILWGCMSSFAGRRRNPN